MAHGYGMKGGTGPNTGKSRRQFRATLPDGRVVKKVSYRLGGMPGPFVMMIYQHKETWYSNVVFDVNHLPEWAMRESPTQQQIPATEIVR